MTECKLIGSQDIGVGGVRSVPSQTTRLPIPREGQDRNALAERTNRDANCRGYFRFRFRPDRGEPSG
jgi:hypothetical protein